MFVGLLAVEESPAVMRRGVPVQSTCRAKSQRFLARGWFLMAPAVFAARAACFEGDFRLPVAHGGLTEDKLFIFS
jgi:hypothetical protein